MDSGFICGINPAYLADDSLDKINAYLEALADLCREANHFPDFHIGEVAVSDLDLANLAYVYQDILEADYVCEDAQFFHSFEESFIVLTALLRHTLYFSRDNFKNFPDNKEIDSLNSYTKQINLSASKKRKSYLIFSFDNIEILCNDSIDPAEKYMDSTTNFLAHRINHQVGGIRAAALPTKYRNNPAGSFYETAWQDLFLLGENGVYLLHLGFSD